MRKELNSSHKIPLIGMGTYKSTPAQLEIAIPEAILLGYRLFDTASVYKNEEAIGNLLKKAMKENNLDRSAIFVTSKLAPADQGYEATLRAVELSLKKLDIDYIDLYLIHWPGTAKIDPSDRRNIENRRESWKALEECVQADKLKSIGVSNFTLKHLKEMEEYARIRPAVNQFEVHPAHLQKDVIDYCERNEIFVQAYASLAEGALLQQNFLDSNPEFLKLAQKYQCTVAQLLLKWPLQRGWGIIPKSINPSRIKENISLDHFQISSDDMKILDNFHEKVSFKKCWDPSIVN